MTRTSLVRASRQDQGTPFPTITAVLAIGVCLACPAAARAQIAPVEAAPGVETTAGTVGNEQPALAGTTPAASAARPPLYKPFVDVLGDFKNLPSWQNLSFLTGGLTAAGVLHPEDASVTREAAEANTSPFKPGAIVGATPLELGAAFATYAIGR